jgi:hypothetical protein
VVQGEPGEDSRARGAGRTPAAAVKQRPALRQKGTAAHGRHCSTPPATVTGGGGARPQGLNAAARGPHCCQRRQAALLGQVHSPRACASSRMLLPAASTDAAARGRTRPAGRLGVLHAAVLRSASACVPTARRWLKPCSCMAPGRWRWRWRCGASYKLGGFSFQQQPKPTILAMPMELQRQRARIGTERAQLRAGRKPGASMIDPHGCGPTRRIAALAEAPHSRTLSEPPGRGNSTSQN